jgi:hypothetical protein
MFDTNNELKVEAQKMISVFALIASSPNKGKLVTFRGFKTSFNGTVDKNSIFEESIYTGMIVGICQTSDPNLVSVRYIDPIRSQEYLSSFISEQSRSELEAIINNKG